MVYLRTLRNIGYYLYRTFSGAQSRVPLGQPKCPDGTDQRRAARPDWRRLPGRSADGMRLHPAVHLLCHSRNSADYRDILLVDMGFVGSLNRL